MSEGGEPTLENLYAYLAFVQEMENGPAQIGMAEDAVRRADTLGDSTLQFLARERLVDAATMGGQPDLALIQFNWLLAKFDAEPDRYNAQPLLWKYKWIPACLTAWPQISLDIIERTLDDMELRYTRYGEGQHAIFQKRRATALDLGMLEQARHYHARLMETQRDGLSDCAACVPNSHIGYHLANDDPEAALRAARPVLDGELACSHVPHTTYGKVLFPLLMLGRGDEAMDYHRRGYKLVSRNPGLVKTAGHHIGFIALAGNLPRAATLLRKHLPVALAAVDLMDRYEFLKQAWIALDILADAGKTRISLVLPDDLSIASETGKYGIVELRDWIESEIADWAAQYDLRNGNDYFTRSMQKMKGAKAYRFTPV